ncbi:hypothetical protein VNO80_01360 [Phaseolus coccineus]|uniref:Uncharacterized protein n=1 Tax=Phaseolus coccineus TaxID=3886 RepID=A0AAN9RSR8_PHACN
MMFNSPSGAVEGVWQRALMMLFDGQVGLLGWDVDGEVAYAWLVLPYLGNFWLTVLSPKILIRQASVDQFDYTLKGSLPLNGEDSGLVKVEA